MLVHFLNIVHVCIWLTGFCVRLSVCRVFSDFVCPLHHGTVWLQDGASQLSPESCLVVALLQQWLVRYLCKRLMQLMTSEAFILYRSLLPSSYLENYIAFQVHFSLKELILKYHQALQHSAWWVQCNKHSFITWNNKLVPNALICTLLFWCSIYPPSGILPAHPQSCFASHDLLHLSTSFQLSILALSWQTVLPRRPSLIWSSRNPLNWWCAHSPASSHRAVCKKYLKGLCCLTWLRLALKLGKMIPERTFLYITHIHYICHSALCVYTYQSTSGRF